MTPTEMESQKIKCFYHFIDQLYKNNKKTMFKINDRVKVKIAEGVEQCGKVINIDEVKFYLYPFLIMFQNGYCDWFNKENITLITDPMDCLMVGDIIENEFLGGTKREIVSVSGKMVFAKLLSFEDESTDYLGMTIEGFKKKWKVSTSQSTKIQEAYDLLVKEGKIVDGKIIK